MRKITLKFILSIISVIFFSIGSISIAAAKEKIDVFVSIPPQAYLAERVGGDRVDVDVMVKPGQSPHTFEPTPKEMTELARANLYFKIGLSLERVFLKKIRGINDGLRIVDTISEVRLRKMGSGGVRDPHLWLDPKNAVLMARSMAEALKGVDPDHAKYYERNLKELTSDLGRLDRRISSLLKPYAGRSFYVYHPAFGYFADAFGIVQISIEVDGKEPGGSELVGIIKAARVHGAKTIFVEPEFSKARARMVANAIDGRVEVLDPLAMDYIVNLNSMAEKIAKALSLEK